MINTGHKLSVELRPFNDHNLCFVCLCATENRWMRRIRGSWDSEDRSIGQIQGARNFGKVLIKSAFRQMLGDDIGEINLGADFERQLSCVIGAGVYELVPPQPDGYHCQSWTNQLWNGRMRVLSKGREARIVLDNAQNGVIFAECPLDHPNAVERVVDSSRYFVIRVVKGARHAFIGMGFKERNEAFDFNVAVDEARKATKEFDDRQKAPAQTGPVDIQSSGADYSLKAGQKITINIAGGSQSRKKRSVGDGGLHL